MVDGPIAYVCPERQVHVIDETGTHTPQTSASPDPLVWGNWATSKTHTVEHSWPTWSPDGKRIACFRIPQGGAPRVLVLEVNGIESSELVDLGSRLPIYLFWSPNGQQLGVLSQSLSDDGDKLSLTCLRPDKLGFERQICEGTPLFFTWFGERIAAYVGGASTGATCLSVTDPGGRLPTDILPGVPSNFCAPVALGDQLLYVGIHKGGTHIMRAGIGDSTPKLIQPVDGLVGLVASPDHTMIACAVAPGGDGTAYRNLSIIDVASGNIREVIDLPCLGYFWTPNSKAIVIVSVDTHRNLMTWSTVNLNGDIDPISEMVPTRDFGFYLRFFEQYSQSHPIIGPSSTHILASGEVFGAHGQGEKVGTWEIPLDGSRPTQISDGVFGVYGPCHSG